MDNYKTNPQVAMEDKKEEHVEDKKEEKMACEDKHEIDGTHQISPSTKKEITGNYQEKFHYCRYGD